MVCLEIGRVAKEQTRSAFWILSTFAAVSWAVAAVVEFGGVRLGNWQQLSQHKATVDHPAKLDNTSEHYMLAIMMWIILNGCVGVWRWRRFTNRISLRCGGVAEQDDAVQAAARISDAVWTSGLVISAMIAFVALAASLSAARSWGPGDVWVDSTHTVRTAWLSIWSGVAAQITFYSTMIAVLRMHDTSWVAKKAPWLTAGTLLFGYLPMLLAVSQVWLRWLTMATDLVVAAFALWPAVRRTRTRIRDSGAACANSNSVTPELPTRDALDDLAHRQFEAQLDSAAIVIFSIPNGSLLIIMVLLGNLSESAAIMTFITGLRLWVTPIVYLMSLAFVTRGYHMALVDNVARGAVEDKIRHQRTFLRYIFHEIRVPLNTIALVIDDQMPAEPDGTAVVRGGHLVDMESAAALRSALDGATTLLNDVLTVEKMESGNFSVEKEPFRPAAALEQVAQVFGAACAAKGVTLSTHTELEALEGCAVEGDEHRLRQVMSNILSNSTKFTPCGGRIHAVLSFVFDTDTEGVCQSASVDGGSTAESTAESATPGDVARTATTSPSPLVSGLECVGRGSLRFEVRDTGVGIDPGQTARLFLPFQQVRASMLQKGGGSGLGLSICRAIVEAHGGTVGCHSDGVGKGSRFWFTVPVRAIRTTGTAASSVAGGTSSSGNQSIEGRHEHKRGGNGRQPEHRASASQLHSSRPSSHSTPHAHAVLVVAHGEVSASSMLDSGEAGPSGSGHADGGDVPVVLATPVDTSGAARGSAAAGAGRTVSRTRARQPIEGGASGGKTAGSSEAPKSRALAGSRVLVVDDSDVVRRLMRRLVQSLGATEVNVAEDGAAALTLFLQRKAGELHAWDIVITDYTMPRMSGTELTQRLRKAGFPGLVLGATGHAMREDRRDMLAAGMDEVLAKPVRRTELVAALERARDVHRLREGMSSQLISQIPQPGLPRKRGDAGHSAVPAQGQGVASLQHAHPTGDSSQVAQEPRLAAADSEQAREQQQAHSAPDSRSKSMPVALETSPKHIDSSRPGAPSLRITVPNERDAAGPMSAPAYWERGPHEAGAGSTTAPDHSSLRLPTTHVGTSGTLPGPASRLQGARSGDEEGMR